MTRRAFLSGLTLSGTAGLLGLRPRLITAEPPPETTRIRLVFGQSICIVPRFIAEELLKSERFTHVEFVKGSPGAVRIKLVAGGDVDLVMSSAGGLIVQVDAGEPVVALTGIHIDCFDLFGSNRVGSLRNLKGKKLGVPALGDSCHLFVASTLSYVGLDPWRDIDRGMQPTAESMQLFTAGRVDAVIGFPP